MSEMALRARIRNEVIAELQNVVRDAGQPDGHILVFSDYEVANLRAAFQACGYGSIYYSPLQVLNNGDWMGQIMGRLYNLAPDYPPNVTPEKMATEAKRWNDLHG